MERPPGSNRRLAPNRQRTVVQRAAPNLQTTQPTNQAGTYAVRHVDKQTNKQHATTSPESKLLFCLFAVAVFVVVVAVAVVVLVVVVVAVFFFFLLLLVVVVVVVNFEACKRPQTESSAHGCRSMPLKAANPPTQTCPGQA